MSDFLILYPKVVETSVSFTDFCEALCCEYPWSPADAVELRYFDSTKQRFLPLTCDEHLGLLFSLNAESRFGKIHIGVLQAHKQRIPKGKGVQTSSVSPSSERPRTSCRLRPSKPSGSESHNLSAAANSDTSPLPSAPDVEVDAEPDEEVP